MNFLQTIKQNLNDENRRRGMRKDCIVDSRALRELVENFERMDYFARSMSDQHASLEHKLHNVMQALYSENHDSEKLMLLIMDILKPMILERVKESKIDQIYSRYK